MRCDKCNYDIHDEGGVYDHILCYDCNRRAVKDRPIDVHCYTCGCKRVVHDRITKAKRFLKKTFGSDRFITVGCIVIVALVMLACFKPMLAKPIIFGVASLVIFVPSAIILFYAFKLIGLGLAWLILVCVHDFGKWLYKGSFLDNMRDEDMAGFLRWLFGVLTLLSPVVLYWLGRFAYWMFTR